MRILLQERGSYVDPIARWYIDRGTIEAVDVRSVHSEAAAYGHLEAE